ncbi:MAG TPA: DNA methyltransferase [Acidimicrobiales bacterium]|nr:DNA methyltransferase [Acidimicrobiales bacterium]
MTADVYDDFVASKVAVSGWHGFDIDPAVDVHPMLLDHQRAIVAWAVKGGRRAIFAAFGLGKTLMQLEIVRLVMARAGGPGLIVVPLGVRQEFARDARSLGITTRFIRRADDIDPTPGVVHLTNYETIRDGRLDPALFTCISLDEASVLRSYGSKTSTTFLEVCSAVPYRFVATATPSPNRHKELLHYAGFLGVMDVGQALTRWFKRDSQKAGNLQLFEHKADEFWLWLASWAVFLRRPSDLGYSDDGYLLPDIEVVYHEVPVDHTAHVDVDRDGQGRLYRGAELGVVAAAREKRATLAARVAKAADIVNASPDDHFVLWHDLEDERRALKKDLPDVVDVYGSLDLDTREQRIIDFSEGRHRLLATKPSLSGSGCNFQRHCHRAVFVGIGFDFNDFVQAIHRLQRFQQTQRVRIDLIYAESEREVLRTLLDKWTQHKELTATMSDLIRRHGLSRTDIGTTLTRTMGVERIEAAGDGWVVANNDCVPETAAMDDDSVDLIVTSIPFANHYEYTPSYRDFGHTDNNDHFWAQMDYLTPELLRVLRPGRIYACHVKDRIVFGNMTGAGYSTVSPFHAEAILHAQAHGFEYMGLIVVVTDVVRENNQSYRLGWSENAKDSSKMGVGSPEYVLLFRKPQTDRTRGYADTPVTKDKGVYTRARWQTDAHAFWRSSGDRHLTPAELAALPADVLYKVAKDASLHHVYDYEAHVRVGEILDDKRALPSTFMLLAPASWHPDVWHDINRMRTLNTEQSRRAQEQHVCPLQFDIVDRVIERYSNPDDLIYDPFGGLFTVPVRALHLGRRGRAVELNPAYFADGVKYLQAAERQVHMPRLFDLTALEADQASEGRPA